MKKLFLNSVYALMLLASFGGGIVSCTTTDNPIDGSSEPATPEVTEFYNETVNKLIDENYKEVMANGYAELRIPASLYPKDLIKIPATDKESMDYVLKSGHTAFVNGGAVRDGVLGKELHDVDFSTDATPDELVAIVPNSHKTQAGDLTIAQAEHEGGMRTDMVPYRAIDVRLVGKHGIPETPYTSDKGIYSKNLLDDSYSRDLTINSLYYDSQTGEIIDYHGGLHDLREKIIRTPMDPELTFQVNPQAIMRSVRFAARYEFNIEENTAKAIVTCLPGIEKIVSPSLNRFVVMKGFGDGCAFRTYQYYAKYGILDYLTPMLKNYIGKSDYEAYLKACFDRIDAGGKGVGASLAYAILFMPPVMDELGDKESTLANITAAFDKLEQGSEQDKRFLLEDTRYTKKDPLKIWYLVKLMTTDATMTDNVKIEQAKGEYNYRNALQIINGMASVDSKYKKYADFWNTGAETEVTELSTLTADYEAKDGETLTGVTSHRITIADGATVILKAVSIDNVIQCAGSATIMTAKGTQNRVSNEEGYGSAIKVNQGHTLTLQGNTGELYAFGGIEGAGIGGNGNIVVRGGKILAIGGIGGAGIGSELFSSCGDITIRGGEVAAYGGDQAAGIGSGESGSCGKIYIRKSVTSVLAVAGSECDNAIGAGQGGECGDITIEEGADVTKEKSGETE